ncbi:MAG: valine--tRNA ligase, partial [Hyphomonas sp.]|uniref:valine--tRNA ligase n=1 Tax=Hyphomonas sp. TaxID=87 RepID=UPI0034A049DC
MLDQRFDPAEAEPRLYQAWEAADCFKPTGDTSAQAYSIVIPPPNVTGVLHMGHALNNTLQDVLIRFERMRGKNVLWQPGTDHAGIATQMVVERQLAKEGSLDRRTMGREAFLKRVWAWKEESGGSIKGQLKRLGASCDWSVERFTMDEGLSKAVTKVFVDLHRKGLIYRDKRLVNWDPHFQTAISDLEVETKEVAGHYWHLRYPLADGASYDHPVKDEEGNITGTERRDYIVVATSRPETMLGDTGVAVHPGDARYGALVGKYVMLPIVERRVPIVADEYANPEKGSGAVKITPAHDFNDFEVGKRAGHTPLNILTAVAAIADGAEADAAGIPAAYRGLDRSEAREKVVEAFEAAGLLERIEDLKIEQPFGDRSGVVIEPWMTDQWYVDAATLAKPARAAVEDGRTRFVPENWTKTYYNWMDNIQPWCVSRQLWWGHRIPAWYNESGDVFVAATEQEAQALAGKGARLVQDEDVLDTWFSSALWPFSTQGWPENTEALKTFYPTATLVTAFDIIFFWVARMMMMGIEFTKEAPFKDVYIHALVLDEKGQKMSKSKGNAIDPLEIVDEFGADALRFTLGRMAGQGRNIRLSKQAVESNRNFATKLWNAARFAEMNECGAPGDLDPCSAQLPVNQWILSELADCVADVTRGIEEYRFNEAAGAVYKFIWNTLCDWYLELIKPLLMGMDDTAKAETRAVCGFVLDGSLKLLHPFMPFITEELWERRAPRPAPQT